MLTNLYCSGQINKEKIIGRWRNAEGDTIEFYPDGYLVSGRAICEYKILKDKISVKYVRADETVDWLVKLMKDPMIIRGNFSGNGSLDMSDIDEEDDVFIKLDDFSSYKAIPISEAILGKWHGEIDLKFYSKGTFTMDGFAGDYTIINENEIRLRNSAFKGPKDRVIKVLIKGNVMNIYFHDGDVSLFERIK